MKFIEWRDDDTEISVIERTPEAMDIYGHNYGSEAVGLTQEHIDALKAGKILAWNDGEYTTFVCLVDEMPGEDS